MRNSVLCGVHTWVAYAAVEFLLAYVLTIALEQYQSFPLWAWRPVGLLLAGYVVMGILSGLVGGALLAWRGRQTDMSACRTVAVLSLAVGVIVNLLAGLPLARSEYVALAIGTILVLLLVRRLWNPRPERDRFLENPWVVTFLLIVAPWISREAIQDQSGMVKSVAMLLAVTLIALFAWRLGRFRPRAFVPVRSLLIATAVLLVEMASLWLYSSRIPHLPGGSTVKSSVGSRPNVVLITMDTVRADHLSVYGYPRETTPYLKQLAQDATVFRQAIASADMTLATHASLFTGMYASWHKAMFSMPEHPFGRPLDHRFPSLAEILTRQGYASIAVGGNFAYLQTLFGLTRGFDVAYAPRPTMVSTPSRKASPPRTPERPFYLREGMRRILSLVVSTSDFDRRTITAGEVQNVAYRLLETNVSNRPFFLFLNYIDAHVPYVPTAPYDRLFPGKDPSFSNADYEELKHNVLTRKRNLSARELDHLLSQYDGAIAYIDSQIGALIEWLKQRSLYENTLIIVTADHGEAFGDKYLMEHGVVSLYQNQVHVPLLIKYPGPSAPAVVDEPVSHVDAMPTVLSVLGYPIPSHVQGRSLAGNSSASRLVISEAFPNITHDWNPAFTRLKRALVVGPIKLIAYENGRREVYDLSRDADERKDLAGMNPATEEVHLAQLRDWMKAIPKETGASRTPSVKNLEALKSLGYAQ